MRSRYRINDADAAHFITATVIEWLPVFTTAGCCDILVQSLEHCRAHKGLQVHAWVILDNHFHAVVAGPGLANAIGDWKRFTAGALLKQIKLERRAWLLDQLAFRCAKHKSASDHQLWQEGVHPQAIVSDDMMEQKLNYIHDNPVKRGLVASREHWKYSSAHEWLPGAVPAMRSDTWR